MFENNHTAIERQLGRIPMVHLKGVKEVPTMLIRRKADQREVLISKKDYDPRLHDKIDAPIDTEIEAPEKIIKRRKITMTREILEAMTLSEIKSLPQWPYIENHERISTKVAAIKAVLVAAGIEEPERTIQDIEAELIEKAEAKEAEAQKAAAKVGRTKKSTSEDE